MGFRLAPPMENLSLVPLEDIYVISLTIMNLENGKLYSISEGCQIFWAVGFSFFHVFFLLELFYFKYIKLGIVLYKKYD